MAAAALRRVRPQRAVAAGLAAIGTADAALIWAAPNSAALLICVAVAGAGIGLSSVAATGLGTDVDPDWRGTASGIINTAPQLGTALGIAALLLVAAATDRTPGPTVPVPAAAWALAGAVALCGAAAFTARAAQLRHVVRGLPEPHRSIAPRQHPDQSASQMASAVAPTDRLDGSRQSGDGHGKQQ